MVKKINRITKKDGRITKTKTEMPKSSWSQVRIQLEIYEEVADLAKAEGRSTTMQVNIMLAQALKKK